MDMMVVVRGKISGSKFLGYHEYQKASQYEKWYCYLAIEAQVLEDAATAIMAMVVEGRR